MARYIDADKLKERLEIISVVADDLYGMGINRGIDRAETEIDMLPTADVEEVKHGQWLPQIVCGVKVWDCSECKTLGSPDWKRCPICEAKMDGGKQDGTL